MKFRLTISFLFVWCASAFGQENPWQPRGNDPWVAYKKSTESVAAQNRETSVSEMDTLSADSLIEGKEDFFAPYTQAETKVQGPRYLNKNGVLDHIGQELLQEDLERYADTALTGHGYFVAGFFSGLTLGLMSIPVDAALVIPDTKAEQSVQKEVSKDAQFNEISGEKLKKERRKATNKKQFRQAILGSVMGMSVQVIFLITGFNL